MNKHYYDRKSEKSSRPKQSNTTTFKGKYGMFSKSRRHKVIFPPIDPEYYEVLYGPELPEIDPKPLLRLIEETNKNFTESREFIMSPSSWELSRLIAERKKSTESNLTSRIAVALVSLLSLYVFVKLCKLLLF